MATAMECQYEALAQQSDALHVIFESLPWGVIVADHTGRFLFSNPAAERILGIGAVELLPDAGTSLQGWYLPDQISIVPPDQLPLVRAIRGQEVLDELVYLRNSHASSGLWIRVNAWPLKDLSGVVSGGVIMFHDFTQGREALQSFILLSRVVEQTADSVVLTDTQGVIQYVNPAFEATTGYSRDEALGKTPRILKSGLHDAEFYRQMWTHFTHGAAFKGMVINRKKTGELYWAQQTITSMRDEAGHLTHFVSVSQDVTELRKKQEQEFQLQLARDVQQRFYAAAPVISGFDIGGSANPADATGGDYFDFITMADNSLVIAVADAKGHGFSSALVMSLTRAYLRSFAAMQLEVDEILARVNQMLLKDLEHGHFVTLFLARLIPHTGTLSYASAGHVPGFVLCKSGELKCSLESTGPPLGLFPVSQFALRRAIQLEPGEIVVFLTDGVTESTTPDGSQFGTQRVLDYVHSRQHEAAGDIARGIYEAARAFAQEDLQDDDITSVIVKVESAPNRSHMR
ncbi:MAG TPA: SpoIIE family protein phosphatase [Terriglobales bacterium]|nr:SpoIIE family protein phosphatase [Terriglobales bacterium]